MERYDISVVGGGIVGLATAYKVQLKYPNINIIVIEKEKKVALHQTGRNSGVIHSGLYYTPGSFRAKNCVEGRQELVDFARRHKIPHDICGKIILATNEEEVDRLLQLKKNGEKNGLTGLKLINTQEVQDIEPFAVGLQGLFVPQAGIIDYQSVAKKFTELIQQINKNSRVVTDCEVIDIKDDRLFSTKGDIICSHSIFCGGLFSDRLAQKDNAKYDMRIVGFRGDYYMLKEDAKHKVKNLIYPVPNPEFPFLGVHFTRMTDGSIECGPNAVFTFKREGYKRLSFSMRDTLDSLSFLGTWRLFINHWKFGLNEYMRSFSKRLFLNQLRRMIPSLRMRDIEVGRSGVRAMALDKNGEIIDDFRIVSNNNNIHVLNAPSPAATACLAIADEILKIAEKDFNLKIN